jgi:hypothetical protein
MTVKDLIDALSKMPADARVVLMGSYETYDGYSHPFVELDADGEVVIREADEDEADAIELMRQADSRIE